MPARALGDTKCPKYAYNPWKSIIFLHISTTYNAIFSVFDNTNPHCPSVEKQKISGVW